MLANQKSRPRKRPRIIIFFIILLVFGGGVYFVWFFKIFEIRSVDVNASEIVKAQLGTTFELPQGNILFWKLPPDINDIDRIRNINIYKDFLERKIIVQIEDREKDIIWCLEKKDECFWIDSSGFAFGDAPHPLGLIMVKTVRDYTDRTIKDGDTVLEKILFDNLQLIFSLLGDVDLPVSELRIDDLKFKEATAVISDGPDIYFSLLLNPGFGKSVIESLSNSSEWANIRYIDLRVENRAYYSL
jgi:hypothetical protein